MGRWRFTESLTDEYIDLTTPENPYSIKEERITSSTLSRSSELSQSI